MQADVPRTGGQILVDQLVAQGVEHVYCVPGESYLAVLDALHDAASGHRLPPGGGRGDDGAHRRAARPGGPGVCFVTRGPGATNAAHGVHIAEHDSAPLILFVGQVERAMLGRGAFQEMDYRAFFGSTAKWATEIEDPARIPEIVQRAFHVAMQGRPGPVVDRAARGRADRDGRRRRRAARRAGADLARPDADGRIAEDAVGGAAADRHRRRRRLDAARGAALLRFAERFDLPVAASFRRASALRQRP